MSKSERNYTDPMEIVKLYGADSLRFALMNSAVVRAEDLKFSEDSVKEVLKTLIIPLWNAYSFFVTYANIDGYEPSETAFKDLTNPMDRWYHQCHAAVCSGSNRRLRSVRHPESMLTLCSLH